MGFITPKISTPTINTTVTPDTVQEHISTETEDLTRLKQKQRQGYASTLISQPSTQTKTLQQNNPSYLTTPQKDTISTSESSHIPTLSQSATRSTLG